jgi:hypothetical protein
MRFLPSSQIEIRNEDATKGDGVGMARGNCRVCGLAGKAAGRDQNALP